MAEKTEFYVRWLLKPNGRRHGYFDVVNGSLLSVQTLPSGGAGEAPAQVVVDFVHSIVRIVLETSQDRGGDRATVVEWVSDSDGFSFLPGFLSADEVAEIPGLGVRLGRNWSTVADDGIVASTSEDTFRLEPAFRGREITWEAWAARTQKPVVPTVLGVPRDHRFFVFDSETCTVSSKRDLGTDMVLYDLNRPAAADLRSERHWEDGFLPILHMAQRFGGLLIEDTAFVSLVDGVLSEDLIQGTPLRIAHLYSSLGTFPDGQREEAIALAETFKPAGEIVLFLRTRMTNVSSSALLAPLALPRAVRINRREVRDFRHERDGSPLEKDFRLDEKGVLWTDDAPCSRHWVNGGIARSLQLCELLAPGQSLQIDSVLSHGAAGLSEVARSIPISWDAKFEEAKTFWKSRLASKGRVGVPERRLERFWNVGRAHLDLLTLGEKTGPLLAKVGIYTCIGTESIPVVEFYDSLGCHDEARRCIDTFFELQHASGRINTYQYYDIETGAVLYLVGRHYDYTRDREWIRSRIRQCKAAADYLLSLRNFDLPEGAGYGLVAGTCADPKDTTSAFMLNAYNAAGLRAVARLLSEVADADAPEYAEAAKDYENCLRRSFENSFRKGPIVPVSTNRWVPTCAFRAEGRGPHVLGLMGEASFTHRSYFAFDSLLGPQYVAYLGVIEPRDRLTGWMLEVAHRHYHRGMVAESQPFYSRHPELHLMRGERELFLNAFYSGLAATSDHETFTFWEHIHKVSLHKTHEEAWSLMQLRRMLWLEEGSQLHLLAGIPEAWLDPGKVIEVEKCGSLFGGFSFRVARTEDGGVLRISWKPEFHTTPSRVILHLPSLEARTSPAARLRAVPQGAELTEASTSFEGVLELARPPASDFKNTERIQRFPKKDRQSYAIDNPTIEPASGAAKHN